MSKRILIAGGGMPQGLASILAAMAHPLRKAGLSSPAVPASGGPELSGRRLARTLKSCPSKRYRKSA